MEETTVKCQHTSYYTGCHRIGHSGVLHTLGNQAVQVLVVGTLDTEVAAADIVDGLVVDHEGTVGVLEGGVGGEDGVVRLNDRGGGLGSGIHAELQLALLAVVDGQALHQESTETRTSTTTERVEDQESLETGTAVGNAAHLVQNGVNKLLADGVVTTGVVVGGILLAGNHLLGVEKASVGSGADLIDDVGLKIAVNSARDVLALTYITEYCQIATCAFSLRLMWFAYQSRRRKC
jgi:hypothetical protein